MSSDRWLIAGLGNPGTAYAHNRHNVGYWCVNRLARLHGIDLKARRVAAVGEGEIAGQPVTLLKPRTFVNNSGHAVGPALRHAHVPVDHLIVLYDELDLPSGRVRIKPKGGHGGHNGLRSIVGAIGGNEFPRIRIGIGRPHVDGEPSWDSDVVAVYVLGDPPPSEVETLRNAVSNAAKAVEMIVTEGLDAAMNRFNK
jgi:PTH1 family peptidyl-tRNA hydrolase